MKVKSPKIRDTLNSYIHSGYEVLTSLRWDLRPISIEHKNRLKNLLNSRKNEKAVIICNGPSLNDIDLNELKGVYTFGLNKINLIFDKTTFRPNSIVAVNDLVVQQNKDFFNNWDGELFIGSKGYTNGVIKNRKNVTFFKSTKVPGFAKNCTQGINPSHTVTNIALQLAYHMGFASVGLVGLDHFFGNVDQKSSDKVVEGEDIDSFHFDKNYFANMPWQLPNYCESEVGYLRAKHAFERDGRHLYNCSTKTNLDLIKKLNLDEFLQK